MRKYDVRKTLELSYKCVAGSSDQAVGQCIDASESDMDLVDCQYDVSLVEHCDTGLSTGALSIKYIADKTGHPDFPVLVWMREVTDGNTLRGYWDWVAAQIEESNLLDDGDND
jgi:hypothetical protein